MIITKWRLFNFKSVRDDTEIELKPLTIFAGSNSSGKSTVLQAMLLISQTLWSRDNSKPFILNGMFTRLGQFDDLRSFDSEANQILIGWQLQNLSAQSGGPVELAKPYIPTIHKEQNVPAIDCFCTVFYKIYPILGRLG